MKQIKILIAAFYFAALSIVPLAGVQIASAQVTTPDVQGRLCQGADGLQWEPTVSGDCTVSGTDATNTVNDFVALVINIFSWIVGVISVIMIIYGGFKYITSGGDTGNITTAKNTILYAIIGLVIVALAQLIVRFVLGTVTGQVNPA